MILPWRRIGTDIDPATGRAQLYMCPGVYVCICARVCVCVRVRTCVRVCERVCVYIYIYIYVHRLIYVWTDLVRPCARCNNTVHLMRTLHGSMWMNAESERLRRTHITPASPLPRPLPILRIEGDLLSLSLLAPAALEALLRLMYAPLMAPYREQRDSDVIELVLTIIRNILHAPDPTVCTCVCVCVCVCGCMCALVRTGVCCVCVCVCVVCIQRGYSLNA